MVRDSGWKAKQEKYEKEVDRAGYRSGDKVRIESHFDSLTNGWSAFWSELFMTPRIGQTGVVVGLEGCAGIRVEFDDGEAYNFPYQALNRD